MFLTVSRWAAPIRPVPRAKRYHHGDLRRALIEGSIALIAEEGVEALTLRRLAKRIGVSHAAPQHHFANKEALLVAVAEEGFAKLRDTLQRAAKEHEEPFERLSAAGVAYVGFAAQHPAHFRVMFGPHLGRAAGITDETGSVLLEASTAVGVALGDVSLARTISTAAWSLVHGLATLWLDGPLKMSEDGLLRRAREVTALVTEAMRATERGLGRS